MSILNEPLPNIVFEYPVADVILRSYDDDHLRVPKTYLVHCSPVLDLLIQKASNVPDDAPSETSLPVVRLPESGAVLHSLLTFIFPTTPLVPSTIEEAMKLLSVAQKYQMVPVLGYIRYHIAQQNPPSTQQDDVLHRYSLAQKYGLHQEALQAAQTMLMKYPMNVQDDDLRFDVVSGASLYELLNYRRKARKIIAVELMVFNMSGAGLGGTLKGFRCAKLNSAGVPCWIDDYIASIADTPNNFDLIKFNTAMSRHIWDMARNRGCMCSCSCTPSWTIRNFWDSLTSVVHDSLKKVSTVKIYELLPRLKPF